MKLLREKSPANESGEMLADVRTLSLVIARLKLHSESCTDKKKKKQYNLLTASLSLLSRVRHYIQLTEGQSPVNSQSVYIDGLPRWTFQIKSQFGHYVNPASPFQEKWQQTRASIWAGIENTIPSGVRDLLLGWRWKAEISAFRKISTELENSQSKVKEIEEQFHRCERSASAIDLNLGLLDRFRILKWSGRAKVIEAELPRLEELKQKRVKEIAVILGECEDLAARIAFEMKTAMVDCGDYFPLVFEECTRAIDNEIKKDLSRQFFEKMAGNEVLRKNLEQTLKSNSAEFRKSTGVSSQFDRKIAGEWDRKMSEAKNIIEREFLCLNALEIEQQEAAHERWKHAVHQMGYLVRTAEESLLHGRGIN
jgi:hypothetical protein